MVSSFTVIRGGIRATSAVSPRLAGRFATQAFSLTQPRMPVREADAVTHFAARRGTLRIGSADVTTYRWGAGDRTVLLLHGWRGRASQFAPLVRELVSEGFHVVSFDAPAHGDSTGRRTDIRDWIEATEQLQRAHGRFSAIVGHSFGALAGLTAARNGVTTGAVAAISGSRESGCVSRPVLRGARPRRPDAGRLRALLPRPGRRGSGIRLRPLRRRGGSPSRRGGPSRRARPWRPPDASARLATPARGARRPFTAAADGGAGAQPRALGRSGARRGRGPDDRRSSGGRCAARRRARAGQRAA